MRPCNITDTDEMLFEPSGEDWSREKLNLLASSMYCLDDPNLVELEGQFQNDAGTFLVIEWKPCGIEPNLGPPDR